MTELISPRVARASASLRRPLCLLAALTAWLTLSAGRPAADGGVQYFFLNCADWQYSYRQLRDEFGPQEGQRVRVGEAAMFYIFERPMYTLVPELREHLRQARQYRVPLLVELDPVTFCNAVPDLWNWWNPAYYGYDERNRRNVEWTDWTPDSAVSVGWLNWGRQLRITPMMNLYSPAYWRHVRYRMNVLLGIVSEWYNALPEDERWLLCGVKVTGATVHFVTEGMDEGPIIAQKPVLIEEGDTPEVLQRRVMEQAEWILLPQAIDDIANGRIAVENGRTVRK